MVLSSGIFTNNGAMNANDGSSITFQASAANTNLTEGVLAGGTWRAIAAGHGATLSLTGGPIVVDAATIVLQGAGSVMQAGSGSGATPYTPLEQSLTTIAAGGQLEVVGGRGYASAQNLDVSGMLQVQGGTFQANALTLESGSLLYGWSTVNDAVANSASIEAHGSVLTITGNVTGSGALQADSGATLALNGASNNASTVLDNGTLSIGTGDKLDVIGSVGAASTGVFNLNNGSDLEVAVDTGASNRMSFIGSSDTLTIDSVAQFGSNVGLSTYAGPEMLNFGVGDSIEMKGFAFAGASIDSYNAATGLLQLHSGAALATLMFQNSSLGAGSGGIDGFYISNDNGNVLLTHHS
jgi:hypothetical protein